MRVCVCACMRVRVSFARLAHRAHVSLCLAPGVPDMD